LLYAVITGRICQVVTFHIPTCVFDTNGGDRLLYGSSEEELKMNLTKKQQIHNLKKLFGSNFDLIDLESHVDGRLTYEENKNIILEKARSRGVKTKSKSSFKSSPIFFRNKAEEIHNARSTRSKAQDSRFSANKTYDSRLLTVGQFNRWKKNPCRYDISGVDTRGSHAKTQRKKKFSIKDLDEFDIL
jgi:hypothetical protein